MGKTPYQCIQKWFIVADILGGSQRRLQRHIPLQTAIEFRLALVFSGAYSQSWYQLTKHRPVSQFQGRESTVYVMAFILVTYIISQDISALSPCQKIKNLSLLI